MDSSDSYQLLSYRRPKSHAEVEATPFVRPEGKPLPSPPSIEVKRQLRGLVTLWRLELLASIFSIGCIAAIVALLATIDGKPYSHFGLWKVDITPNSLISIMSILSKSSLLLAVTEGLSQLKWIHFQQRARKLSDLQVFDSASRGPLGALKLLWSLRFRAAAASCGAILTVLALATEPFVQQILTYPNLLRNATNVTASVSSAHHFDDGNHLQASGYIDSLGLSESSLVGRSGLLLILSADVARFPLQLEAVLSQAIIGNAMQASYNCPSGTCSWPSFRSLGICSHCTDVSNSIDIVCRMMHDINHPGFAYCQYTAPHGVVFDNIWDNGYSEVDKNVPSRWLASYGKTAFENNVGANDTSQFGYSFTYDSGMFFNMTFLRFNNSYPSGNYSLQHWETVAPSVHQCELSFCIKTYSDTACVSGAFNDQAKSSEPVNVDLLHCTVANPDLLFSYTVCPAYPSSAPRPTANALNYSLWRQNPDQSIYWLNQDMISTLQSGINQSLFAPTSVEATTETNPSTYALYYANGGNIPDTLDSLTTSMTNLIRQSPNSTLVSGTVQIPVTYVRVDWVWLIYPATLTLLAAAFLLTAMLRSMGETRLIWKSSCLPLLFHGFEEREPGRIDNVSEMEIRAAAMRARLSQDDSGSLSFVEAKPLMMAV